MVVTERHADLETETAPPWRGDEISIEVTQDRVRLSAGVLGIAPLYLTVAGPTLHASWDMTDLRPYVDHSRLVNREVARLLAVRFRYGHETIFDRVIRLTERSVAEFTEAGLTATYPPPAWHTKARRLREEADVPTAYERLLGAVVGRRVYEPGSTCIELSGGLDSANVAATLGDRHPRQITSAAMSLPYRAGSQQAARRDQLRQVLHLGGDLTVPFVGRLPLSHDGRRARGLPISPYEDPYDEARHELLTALAERGISTVHTGVGGDEMVAPTSSEVVLDTYGVGQELKPWIGKRTISALETAEHGTAPATVVNEMTLLAQACGAPAFLRARIWPIHPLADPELIRFGEWLPFHWRHRKRLHRERLERRGCTPVLLNPPIPENFAPVMRRALTTYGPLFLARMLREGSPLIDRDFIDPDGLSTTKDRIACGRFTRRDTELFFTIAVDTALRSFA